MTLTLANFDSWLAPGGPAAITLREVVEPVDGPDGVFFPPTYAPSEDKKSFDGGYNIDWFGKDNEHNICLVDSVGSQSNRIEPMFGEPPYASLVPQITILAGEHRIRLLDAGHRAGDAIVRCSGLQAEVDAAFRSLLRGDAEPLARIAPTSLVFGAWDSRESQAKVPRLLASTIRAYDVTRLTRSAQYFPPLKYEKEGLIDDPAEDKKKRDEFSGRGFLEVPATGSHGGVIARSGIRRDAQLHLAALRLLRAKDHERTLTLRRYVLGLALVAFTSRGENYLRQGCNLVPSEAPRDQKLVHADGRREPLGLSHEQALAWATLAANAFGVAAAREVPFSTDKVKADLAKKKK